jgi:hypothetical protein
VATSPLADAPGELAVRSARGRNWTILRAGVTRAVPAGPGYLLLSAGNDLQATTFDERTLALSGGADSVLASITGGDGIAHFAIGGGTVVAATSPPARAVSWNDGSPAGGAARLASIAIAPDGGRAAGIIADGTGSDVWVTDLASGTLSRITYGGSNVSPAWSPDGSRIFFATRTSGPFGLASRKVDGREPARTIGSGAAHAFPSAVSADGRIAVTTVTRDGHTAVAIVPPDGGAPQMLEAGPFNERSPAVSPDGKWVALESDESGRSEIVARAIDGGRRVAISNGGGIHPQWSADGRAIYFASGSKVIRATLDPATHEIRARETAIERPSLEILAITPGGRALLAERPAGARALVVLQWLRELRQRLPLPITAPK